jgi:hypothetical protein
MATYERIIDLAMPITSFEPRMDGTPLQGLGWLEVAAALAHVPAPGADLLRALYLDDARALRRTLRRLRVSLSGNPALSSAMAEALALASVQAFAMQRPCQVCNGFGSIPVAAHDEMDEDGTWTHHEKCVVECYRCEGEGLDYIDLGVVQSMLRVGPQVWEKLVAIPFLDCYEQLRQWDSQAKAILARRIR